MSGRPTPLVMAEDAEGNANFSVPDEAVAALRKFDGPIAIVAVVGLYRTGKSYLVNRIVGHQHGFKVGPTINACTKGIWMWSEPIPFENSRGEKLQLLVLDTEGIGGTDASSDYDTRIFSLAVLLCSTLVYNSLGTISEEAIGNLSFVANLSQHVRVKATQGNAKDNDEDSSKESTTDALSSFFPSFMWVIRDFSLVLEDEDYNEITELDYLNNSLKLREGFSSDVQAKNRIRQSLTSFFTKRDCVTIVRPLVDETKLQQIDDEPYESLRPEFRARMEKFRADLLDQLTAKTLQGKPMSGSMFSTLARTFVEAMNSDGVPTITTAWDHVAKTETKEAMSRAIEAYQKQLAVVIENDRTGLPMDANELSEQHKRIKKDVKTNFLKSAVGEGAIETYMPKLKQKMQGYYNDACSENDRVSLELCSVLFVKLLDEHITSCLPNAPGVNDVDMLVDVAAVRMKLDRMRDTYKTESRGPQQDFVWQSKLTDASFVAYSAVLAWEQEKKDEEIRAVEQRARNAEAKLSTVAATEEILREELEMSRKEGGSQGAESQMLMIKLSGQEQEVEVKKKQLADMESKLKAAKDKEEEMKKEYEIEMEKIKLELKEERDKEQPIMAPAQGGCGCVLQ